jgi:hypothetical protein
MEKQSFEYKLIKGRIAETIFELMFRETKKFSVLHFGYESTIPTLAQYRDTVVMKKVLNQVEKSPDFVLVTENKEQVYFVEVKYRSTLDKEEILQTALDISKRWELCYLFIVSRDGFYFSSISSVINESGNIEPLSPNWVHTDIQEKYRSLSHSFFTKFE